MSCARRGSRICGQGNHTTNECAMEKGIVGEKGKVVLTDSVAAGNKRSPITRQRPAENEEKKRPRLRTTGTRTPELAVYCSLDGDIVGIDGGVKDPCGGGDPTAWR